MNKNVKNEDDEDALLQQALAMSMEKDEEVVENEKEIIVVEEPDEKEDGVCIIQLRMPQNKKIERRFKKEHTLNDVANYVKSQDASFDDIIFVCPPMNSYNDMEMKLDAICTELNSQKLSFIVKENANKLPNEKK